MIVIGARGFAKEVLEVLHQLDDLDNLVFFDDVNSDAPEKLFGKFPVLRTIQEASNYFKNIDKRFTIGIGNPLMRKQLYEKFSTIGGEFTATISPNATIGSYDVYLGKGINLLTGVILSNSITIGNGCIIYYNSIITHDTIIGDFVEISPNVILLGRVEIGSYSQIGTNATILPDVIIGQNVIVAAGAVVTKNVPDNSMVAGIPALTKKELKPLMF